MNLNARASVTDWYDDYVLAVRESEIFFFIILYIYKIILFKIFKLSHIIKVSFLLNN